METHDYIREICAEVTALLLSKNRSYGDSATNPIRIFSKADAVEGLNIRMDDKLSRIKKGDGFGDEDAELDLIGYLILKRVAKRMAQDDKDTSRDKADDRTTERVGYTRRPDYLFPNGWEPIDYTPGGCRVPETDGDCECQYKSLGEANKTITTRAKQHLHGCAEPY
jgi:hypothetical protein